MALNNNNNNHHFPTGTCKRREEVVKCIFTSHAFFLKESLLAGWLAGQK
jgi:hypothetical protein